MTHRTYRLLLGAATALALTAASACGGTAPAAPADPAASIVIGVASDVPGKQRDPAVTTGGNAIPFLYSVYDGLYRFDAQGTPQPQIASGEQVSPDGLRALIDIKPGLTFHDGSPLTAEDVKFSLDRARGADPDVPSPTSAGSLKRITAITVVTPTQVRIDLSAPFPTLTNSLAYFPGLIVPEAYVKEVGTKGLQDRPIGSGPYSFVGAKQGQSIELAAFPGYRTGAAPAYRAVELRVLVNGAARIAQLQSGQIQLAVDVDVTQIAGLTAAGFTVTTNPAGQILAILFSSKVPGIADPRVGLALNLAVNRQAMIDALFLGAAVPTPGLDPTSPMADIPVLPHDPVRARALLAEARFDPGRPLVLDYPAGNYPQGDLIVQAIQSDLAAVGVAVELRAMDTADWTDKLGKRRLDDMTLFRLANTTYDAAQTFGDDLTCKGSLSLWCDGPLDAAITDATGKSGAPREQAFDAVNSYIAEHPPGIFLLQPSQVFAMRPGVVWEPTRGIRNYTFAQIHPA